MDYALRLALMFGLGIFVQAVFLIKNDFRKNIWRFLGSLAPSIALAAAYSALFFLMIQRGLIFLIFILFCFGFI